MVDIPTQAPETLLYYCKNDYENWAKEDLIKKIRKLECHVSQLRNVIAKRPDNKQCFLELDGKRKREGNDEDLSVSSGRKAKKPRPFDFTR